MTDKAHKRARFNSGKEAALTQLCELLRALATYELRADAALEIHSITCDSRVTERGGLFAALPGARENGEAYLSDAFARGAACVLCEHAPADESIPCVIVPDAHDALARLAAYWYGSPAEKMTIVGVTGTNGKTTVTWLLKQLLERCAGAKVGLIGTNQNMIGETVLPAVRTTPDTLTLQRLLRKMADEGCTHVVMEVSSHALVQRRVGAIGFALGVFTNLTQDHLDYHGTMEAYCDAKALLFRQCRAAVVNGDDPWTPRILARSDCPIVSFGQSFSNDLVGWRPEYRSDCVRFTACTDSGQVETALHIPGAFSLYNALAALGAMQVLGVPLAQAAEALPLCRGVRGRAEVVPVDADYTVLIDYAHTPDGLKNILTTVCGFADGRVIVVFGCGGDRDKGKRAEMGRIAAQLADFVVLTSDNPRTEDPYAILREILAGMLASQTPFAVLEDRRAAIACALSQARRGDVVVLAGKGHETSQTIGETTLPLDEREIVRSYFARRKS